jgi:zeaxanthin glucosyltransferase
MVAIPLTHDQPAIAARLARTGAGVVIPPRRLTRDRLRAAVELILAPNSKPRKQARVLREAIRQAGGLERAADIVEQIVAR